MAIAIGKPVSFTDIASIVAAAYPEYTVQFSPVGMPLSNFGFVTGSYAEPLFSGVFTSFMHICLAMIAPPNLTVRPMSISSGSTYDLFGEGFFSTAPTAFAVGSPFVAPNKWQEFEGSSFTDQASATLDADALLDAFLAANSPLKCLGCMRSIFMFDDGTDQHFIVVIRASFRQP